MSAVLIQDRLPSEVGDSVTYNRLQLSRAIQARDDPTGEMPVGTAGELLRVLIVDDYRAAADTLTTLVGAWGHDARCAYDGRSAVALATAFQPNVLLLDIAMPSMSGLELALQVRRQPRLNDCFMIAITGFTDAGHRLQSAEAGIDLFLIKPVNPSVLQTLLTLESEYVMKLRQGTTTRSRNSTTLAPPTDSKSHCPVQLPYYVLQGTVAHKLFGGQAC